MSVTLTQKTADLLEWISKREASLTNWNKGDKSRHELAKKISRLVETALNCQRSLPEAAWEGIGTVLSASSGTDIRELRWRQQNQSGAEFRWEAAPELPCLKQSGQGGLDLVKEGLRIFADALNAGDTKRFPASAELEDAIVAVLRRYRYPHQWPDEYPAGDYGAQLTIRAGAGKLPKGGGLPEYWLDQGGLVNDELRSRGLHRIALAEIASAVQKLIDDGRLERLTDPDHGAVVRLLPSRGDSEADVMGKGWPDWLIAVAVAVDEMVEEPKAMRRFREMVIAWKEEHARMAPGPSANWKERRDYNSVTILPVLAMSMPRKYAGLAAIHDEICDKSATRIDPFVIDPANESLQDVIEATPYGILCASVQELRDTNRERLIEVLEDVRCDLANAIAKSVNDPKSPNPPVTELKDPIPIAWLRTVVLQKTVRGASDKLAKWMATRGARIVKIANRNHCERADALKVFSRPGRVRGLIEEYGQDED